MRILDQHTPVLHNRDTVDDGTRFGIDVQETEGLVELPKVFQDSNVIEQHFGVLYVVIWDILDMHVALLLMSRAVTRTFNEAS